MVEAGPRRVTASLVTCQPEGPRAPSSFGPSGRERLAEIILGNTKALRHFGDCAENLNPILDNLTTKWSSVEAEIGRVVPCGAAVSTFDSCSVLYTEPEDQFC